MADSGLDTHNVDSMAGAIYFVVARGTEGGADSYRLSVAGVNNRHWGEVTSVAANSGYSIGAIQVDFGQRGTWALGAVTSAALTPGQTSYVDAVIDQASKYAQDHGLKFTQDKEQLRKDLLSHGDHQHFVGKGKHRHADPQTPLRFIDKDTRDSINAWASSSEGQRWVHKNIDFPQVKNVTQSAMDLLDKYGKNIPEDRRLETIAILAKTANQRPGDLDKIFKSVLEKGGDYEAVLEAANQIKHKVAYYAGPKAGAVAEEYKNASRDSEKAVALGRAQAKVGDANFDPSKSANDPDINAALKAIHPRERHHGSKGHSPDVTGLQSKLRQLGYNNPDKTPLATDGHLGPHTKEALKAFQHDHQLKESGAADSATLKAIDAALKERQGQAPSVPTGTDRPQITDSSHPGNALFKQAQTGMQAIDAKFGRTPDHLTDNAAGFVALTAQSAGMTRIDAMELAGAKGEKIVAAQGALGSAQSKVIDVSTLDALNTPLSQSSQAFAEAHNRQQAQPSHQLAHSAQTQSTPVLS